MEQLAEAPVQTALEPAGFWLRGGALVIDNLLLSLVTVTLAAIMTAVSIPTWVIAVVNVAIPAAYFTWMPAAKSGQTLGKRFAGLSIVARGGEGISYGQAFRRWLGYMLSALTLGIGYLIALFTQDKRALQDMVAGTRVVVVNEISKTRKSLAVAAAVGMPLLALLGLAAALAIPKVAGGDASAGEAVAKAELGQVRSAVSLYAGDNKGALPKDLNALLPKYLSELPTLAVAGHDATAAVTVYGSDACSGSKAEGEAIAASALKSTGGWGYVAAPGSPCDGAVFIDETAQDGAGREWYRY